MSLLEDRIKNAKRSPEYDARPISQMTFSWMNSLFVKGRKQVLEIEDIYTLGEDRNPGINILSHSLIYIGVYRDRFLENKNKRFQQGKSFSSFWV